MNETITGGQLRAKQACEPCRRKKTKCPGQKPVCSTCQRLSQSCTYERTEDAARVQKSHTPSTRERYESDGRVQRLESRVEELFGVIETLSERLPRTRTIELDLVDPVHVLPPEVPVSDITNHRSRSGLCFDAIKRQEPNEDVVTNVIDIYREIIDHQPLPLFDVDSLSASVFWSWPKCLRRSFLSITVPFCSHPFFNNAVDEATAFYIDSAHDETLSALKEGKANPQILQALCVLTQSSIARGNSVSAHMNIAIGIRFAMSTGLMTHDLPLQNSGMEEERARCCWSLFTLDRVYGCNLSFPPTLADEDMLPSYPPSAPTPTSRSMSLQQNISCEEGPQLFRVEDLGITAYCLQQLSIWSEAMSYLKDVKHGRAGSAWVHTSQYSQINARLYQFETKLAQTHRFQKAQFNGRAKEQLGQQRKYWNQWLLMQFLFHAIQGLINHPFIHIAGRRNDFQPPSFMQNTVDQAILHAGWILKFIDACNEQDYQVNDPFMGHLVSIAATIFLFLLNAKDTDLASQASGGYNHCYNFIVGLSEKWPHLKHTVEKLKVLHHGANPSLTAPAPVSAPKAQSSLLWELLDYSVSTTASNISQMMSDDVELNVATRFLSPINPMSAGSTPTAPVPTTTSGHMPDVPVTAASPSGADALWEPTGDPSEWNLFDSEQMAGFTNSTLGRDLWNFGNL